MAAKVRRLPDSARQPLVRGGRDWTTERGTAHVAPPIGAHEQQRFGVLLEARDGFSDCVVVASRQAVPWQELEGADVGDLAAEQPGAVRASRGDPDSPRSAAVVIWVRTGPPDQRDPRAVVCGGGLERCTQRRVQMGLGKRLTSPRSGLLEHDPEPGHRRGAGKWLVEQPAEHGTGGRSQFFVGFVVPVGGLGWRAVLRVTA